MSATGVQKRHDLVLAQDGLDPQSVVRTEIVREAGRETGRQSIVAVDGDLAKAGAEWLCRDGTLYCASTVALMHTRRQHGLLVAAQPPLVEPHVFLSQVDVTLQVGGQSISLATHQFPSVAPTRGYEYLALFAQDPFPRWVFRGPGWEFERTLGLVRNANAVVLRHDWRGTHRAVLEARPLLAMRAVSGLMREHGGFVHRVRLNANDVAVHPVRGLPRVVFRHHGRFVGSPDWWRCFEYLGEHRAGGVKEDLWTPGVFRVDLRPGDVSYLICGVDRIPDGSPEQLLRDALEYHSLPRPGLIGASSSTTATASTGGLDGVPSTTA